MDDFKRKEPKGDRKIKSSIIKLQRKVKKKRRKKQKGTENLKKLLGSSIISNIIKSGKAQNPKNPERLRIKHKQRMEGMFFKGLRSEYIRREPLNEVNEARKNEDINAILDIGNVLLQKGGNLGRSLKRFHNDETNEKQPKLLGEISSDSIEDLKHCSLSPISGLTLTFVQDPIRSAPRTSKRNKLLDLEKEFAIFSKKYEETVGNEVLFRLPKSGVLEDALNALRKIQPNKVTHSENVSEEFQGNESQFLKEFKFSAKDFESEMPTAEDFINNFVNSDNPLVLNTDYVESFIDKSLEEELLTVDEELKNHHHHLSFQHMFGYDEGVNNFVFASQNNFESSAKGLSIKTPPIRYYRRNMF